MQKSCDNKSYSCCSYGALLPNTERGNFTKSHSAVHCIVGQDCPLPWRKEKQYEHMQPFPFLQAKHTKNMTGIWTPCCLLLCPCSGWSSTVDTVKCVLQSALQQSVNTIKTSLTPLHLRPPTSTPSPLLHSSAPGLRTTTAAPALTPHIHNH